MISQPGSPRTRIRPHGPGSPMPAPMRRERHRLFAGRSARSGRCPSRVWKTWKPPRAHGSEHRSDRPDRRTRQRKVVAHLVDVTADPAEIGLHVDDDERRVFRSAGRRCRATDRDRHSREASASPPGRTFRRLPNAARGVSPCEREQNSFQQHAASRLALQHWNTVFSANAALGFRPFPRLFPGLDFRPARPLNSLTNQYINVGHFGLYCPPNSCHTKTSRACAFSHPSEGPNMAEPARTNWPRYILRLRR